MMGDDVQPYNTEPGNISQVIVHPIEHNQGPYFPSTTNATLIIPASTVSMVTPEPQESSNHVLAYVLVPLGSLAFIMVISFVVILMLRKNRMDRLRHHLMPLYNFDPMEEEGDWESELLEEEKEQQVALNTRSSSPRGKLKFHTDV